MNAPTRVCPHCSAQSAKAGPRCPHCRKKFKKRSAFATFAIVVVVLFMLGVGGCAVLIGGAAVAVDDAVKTVEKKSARVVDGSIGKPVSNAGMTYVVHSARTSQKIGDPTFLGVQAPAGATYVIVDLEVRNEKDDTRTFSESSAQLISGDKEFDPDTDASIALEPTIILEEVQPGVPLRGKLAFKVPRAAAAGSTLIVKDFGGNGKVSVPLGL